MFNKNKQILKPNLTIMSSIGKNIRQLRQKNGWSQGEVAKRLNISIPAFSKIETGVTDINFSRLDQIARLFDISPLEVISLGYLKIEDVDYQKIDELKAKVAEQEEEIIKLQKRVIDLYEEIRNK
jgi:transcriptional regulator with XRE-family HTH domain